MNTKALRQKILDLAIHGRLVPPVCRQAGKDPNDEPASVLLQRIREEKERLIKEGKIKKGKKSAKTSGTAQRENVPFEVPESWEWCKLEDICSKFSTGPFGSMVHKTDYVATNGIPMINPANIIDGGISTEKVMLISESKASDLERYKLCVNDIILARRGDLSKCAIIEKEHVDFICGTGSFYLHLISVHPSYFKLFYSTSYVKSLLATECVGATMSNLNQSVLGHLSIPLPPLAEQHRIVAEIERWLSLIDIIESGKASLQTAVKQSKAKILDLAIHGKLVPPVCRQAGKPLQANPDPRIEERKCWFTYVIECKDGSFYKGYTDNLLRRYHQHCIGTGAQYTKVHKPKQLYYWEMHYSEEAALEREKYLKSGAGREWFKKEVVNKPDDFEPASELLRRINPKAEITSDNAQYGKVPKGWCLIKGKDLFLPMKSAKPQGDMFKYIDIDAIDNKSNIIKEIKSIEVAKAPSRASRYTQKNDIVFSMVRPYLRNIAMVKENGCIASTGFYICSPHVFMFYEYCYFLMLSDYVVNGLNSFMKGDNSPSINKGNIDEWTFPLPPLAEQRRIVAKIEELFAQLDLIEAEL